MKTNNISNRKRIIAGSIFAIIACVLIPYVCVVWHNQGCEWNSLAAAIAYYGGCLFAIWFTIDQTIKEKYQ